MRRMGRVVCVIIAAALIAVLLQFDIIGASEAPQRVTSGGGRLTSTADLNARLEKALVLYVGSSAAYVGNVQTFVDPENLEVKPVIKNGRTLVPVRFVAESLGARVDWEAGTSTAIISLGDKQVKLTVGSKKMDVGKVEVTLEAPAEVENGRLLIPLRALAEALGRKVFYEKGLIVITDPGEEHGLVDDKDAVDTLIAKLNNLPTVGSHDKLMELVKKAQTVYGTAEKALGSRVTVQFSQSAAAVDAKAAAPESKAKSVQTEASLSNVSSEYSKTNVQVEGVDEGDIVKTDGQYIYQVNRNRVVIAKAYPAEEMKVLSMLNFSDGRFNPQELYLHQDRMVVIGTAYEDTPYPQPKIKDKPAPYLPRYYSRNTVKAIVYDISNKENIRELREVEAEGHYISSRKIGSHLYMVSNKHVDYYLLENNQDGVTPGFRDTAVKGDFTYLQYDEIRYFPGSAETNYMTITSMDIDRENQAAVVAAYLGAGDKIYASEQNLYVATAMHSIVGVRPLPEPAVQIDARRPAQVSGAPLYEQSTLVYKFSLNKGAVTYISKGEIPGNILNQFSMDENGKNFRIATTIPNAKVDNIYTSTNNVYITDELLNIVGKIENMAPDERIYSVRFMGDRGYVVTFKNVDPLFVLDLKDPKNPSILGALKIPGYSDYLHPYDENHIIGFGKDTVEYGSQAYYQGMKLAIFDVTDVTNPIQKFTENIGDRGTDSELLRNHKALLFSKEKNLLAFPVTVAEIKHKEAAGGVKAGAAQHGSFVFQGAYVYSIDLAKGFSLKGRITHLSEQDYLKAGNHWYGGDRTVERIIYIGDNLYTLSRGMIKANRMGDLGEAGKMVIP